MSEALESDASLLVVVLDINASAWARSPLALDDALQQTIIFINAYLALKPSNQLVVLASTRSECRTLYPAEPGSISDGEDIRVYEQFRAADIAILSGVRALLSSASAAASRAQTEDSEHSLISRALSKALCHINQMRSSTLDAVWPRVLVLSAGVDAAAEYISLMNGIFAAQRMGVLIDVCKVAGAGDSVFLQQAAEISGGVYLRVDARAGWSLLQTLLFGFLADHYTRQVLYLPGNERTDFRATCFCHKRIVDIGFVCSVCLSIFCRMTPVCSTCHTKFAVRGGRVERPAANGANNGTQGTARTISQQLSTASTTSTLV
ncbi:RNA polymerase II transcription factor B subunit 4 [Coemansia interrupta]|uniref:General transcription and DNA repair factor IIH subunit TFB4 n=1 Tax=Coemansia interrupta TaxID=1126814 RepID=A0A9W8H6G1_9FUNG|nr:RNA polymerase II transcription factor B subunit 4 [Coemansia interrupta]